MSAIATLLTRNLHDVFGENDPARRRAAVDEIFTEDCVFTPGLISSWPGTAGLPPSTSFSTSCHEPSPATLGRGV